MTLVPAAPQLFATGVGRVIGPRADHPWINRDTGGDVPRLWRRPRTDRAQPFPLGEIPQYPAPIVGSLTVSLDGWALPRELIKYAGVTPGTAGLYQINRLLPPQRGPHNPEIRLVMAPIKPAARD